MNNSGLASKVLVHNTCDNLESNKDNAASDFVSSGEDAIDDLISDLPETTNGKGVARNFESSGGYEHTLEDFDILNPEDVKEIDTSYGKGKVGTIFGRIKIVARPGSKTGGATLEIIISRKKVIKIRY